MGDLATKTAGLGKTPLAGGDGPTGVDAKYEPEYEELTGQIARLGSLSGAVVDWRRVVELGTTVLSSKSKDLTVGTYLCAGLFEEEGYGGLAAGLEVVADLHEAFGDAMFPTRPRGRANALEWLKERIEAALEKQPARQADGEAVTAALTHLGRLDAAAAERYGDAAPAFGPLRRGLEGTAKEIAAAAEKKEAAAAAPAAAPAPPAAGVGPMGSPDEVLKALAATGPLFKAADPTHPLAYRLPRLAAWAKLTQLPPNQGGKTQIPPPQRPTRQALENLLTAGDWQGLVNGCDARLAIEPLWLDPQRWVVQGLRGLGPAYAAAADGVIGELRLFVTRLTGVDRLTFRDGTPAADGETRMWLESEVLAVGDGGAVAGGEGEAPAWEIGAAEARKLAAGGDLKGALALLQTGARSAEGGRAQFHWRLATARLCQGAGRSDIALPLLEDLDRESVARDLVAWEPALALSVLSALLEARKSGGGKPTPEQVQRMEELRQRLCQLDVVAALDLDRVK
jgi:type VI secretion system protein VasJ